MDWREVNRPGYYCTLEQFPMFLRFDAAGMWTFAEKPDERIESVLMDLYAGCGVGRVSMPEPEFVNE